MGTYRPTPHLNVHDVIRHALPEMNGDQAILYVNEDRTVVAGSFHEAGTHQMLMPFDEFIYIVAGGVKITVEDGDSFEMAVGDCCWLFQGSNVTFEMREGFLDVTVLVSDSPIDMKPNGTF